MGRATVFQYVMSCLNLYTCFSNPNPDWCIAGSSTFPTLATPTRVPHDNVVAYLHHVDSKVVTFETITVTNPVCVSVPTSDSQSWYLTLALRGSTGVSGVKESTPSENFSVEVIFWALCWADVGPLLGNLGSKLGRCWVLRWAIWHGVPWRSLG